MWEGCSVNRVKSPGRRAARRRAPLAGRPSRGCRTRGRVSCSIRSTLTDRRAAHGAHDDREPRTVRRVRAPGRPCGWKWPHVRGPPARATGPSGNNSCIRPPLDSRPRRRSSVTCLRACSLLAPCGRGPGSPSVLNVVSGRTLPPVLASQSREAYLAEVAKITPLRGTARHAPGAHGPLDNGPRGGSARERRPAPPATSRASGGGDSYISSM